MKIVLINNHSVLNAGDYAILLQTLHLVHGAFPEAEIVLTFNEPATARAALPHYRIYAAPPAWGIRQNQHRHSVKTSRVIRGFMLFLLFLSALLSRWFGKPVRTFVDQQKHDLLAELFEADLVIACGGGYLYHWFTFAGALCWCSIILRRPLVLFPQSIGPFHHPLQVRLAQSIVRGADLVLTRETISWQRAIDLGAREARCEPDLAFGLPSAPSTLAQELIKRYIPSEINATMYIGLTAIDWQEQNTRFRGQQRYEQVLVEFINRVTAQGAVVVLFAQTFGPFRSEDDRLVNHRLHQQVRDPQRVVVINEILQPDLLQSLYGCMDYFVATRLHSFILATNAGVPALVIGYLSKSIGILSDMGIADRCLDIQHLSLDRLWQAFLGLQQEGLPGHVHSYVDAARDRHHVLQQE
ncbi:polysaccharide pyruvyl transferase family protein, partial [uncultured Chloroflexus sp.]